jgi:hypothetical protein
MRLISVFVGASLLVWLNTAHAIGSALTYQGYLTDAGTAADGVYDIELALFNVGSGGTAIDVNAFDDVTVTSGHSVRKRPRHPPARRTVSISRQRALADHASG